MIVIINVFHQERDGCRRILDTYDNSFSSNYDPQIHARLQEVGNLSLDHLGQHLVLYTIFFALNFFYKKNFR